MTNTPEYDCPQCGRQNPTTAIECPRCHADNPITGTSFEDLINSLEMSPEMRAFEAIVPPLKGSDKFTFPSTPREKPNVFRRLMRREKER